MMKKIFLLLAFLFQISIVFGQQYSSSNPQYKWGNWMPNNCYKGIYIRVQKAYFNKGANQWYWNWQIQNKYQSKVALSWVFYDKTKGKPESTKARHTFDVNEIWANGSFGSEAELSYLLDNVCFKFIERNGVVIDDCSNDPATYRKGFYYAECDNGIPRYQAFRDGQQNSSSTSSNSTTSSNSRTVSNPSAVQAYTGSAFQFDKSKSYEVYRDVMKDFLVNNGFHLVNFEGDNVGRYIFDEFKVSYSPKLSPPYYIRNISFRNIKSREIYDKLYNMFGCKNADSQGRKCTKYSENKYAFDWFDVSID